MTTSAELAPVESALRKTELLTAASIALGSIENLLHPKTYEDTGVISWQVSRTRFKWTAGERAEILAKIMAPPGYQVLLSLRVAACAVIMSKDADQASKAAALWFLAATNWLLHLRHSFGSDGTDHMNMLLSATLAAGSLFGDDPRAKEACAWFIAGQSCLSYLAAGVAKAVSPHWRDGTAMSGIFRTYSYGDRRLHKVLSRYPIISKVGGWTVIIGETAFPLVLLVPKKMALGLLGTGTAFHVGNAVFMGLNRFVWTFSATYPSVAHCSRALRKRQP